MTGALVPEAAQAAAALRRYKADPASAGACSTIYGSGRPKWWHIIEWPSLPGFSRTHAGSSRSPTVTITFAHALLPGWEYAEDEWDELLGDLDNLAAGRGQPTVATRPSSPARPRTRAQRLKQAQGSML